MRKKIRSFLSRNIKNHAYRVILGTINRNRRLIVINFLANLMAATVEGSTFGIIFVALSVLGTGKTEVLDKIPILGSAWMNSIYSTLSSGQIFIGLVILTVLMQLGRNCLAYVGFISSDYLAARIQSQMTIRLFATILSFSFPCASRYKVGDLTSYVDQAGRTVHIQIALSNNLIIGVMTSLAYFSVLVSLSPALTVITLLLSCGFLFIQKQLIPRITHTAYRATQAQVKVSEQVVEDINALRFIHTFAHQKPSIAQLQGIQHQLVGELQRQSRWLRLSEPIARMLGIGTTAILLILGFAVLKNASAVLPSLITFIIVLERLSTKFTELGLYSSQLAENAGRLSRLQDILDPNGKEFSRPGGKVFPGLRYAIEFENVSLCYSEQNSPALDNLSLVLPKGKVTALVGSSGAGKSSLADLLVGLYPPSQGQIIVDDQDLSQFSLASWRSRLGVVSQDTFVFNRSILENIRYGRADASTEEVKKAAIAAQADEFIADLPDGYHTVVGERGYRLSGGQRQRLALARAILRQPEILILDEATSALDTHSERLVQEALALFQQDRTVLVIAHRLSTIVSADQIIVLDKGRMIERGSHEQLLARGGEYNRFWRLQTLAASGV